MVLEILLALLGGIAAGAAVSWVLAASRSRAHTIGLETEMRVAAERHAGELNSEKQRAAALQAERAASAEREAAQNRQLTQLESERASLESSARHLREAADQQKSALEASAATHNELRKESAELGAQVARLRTAFDAEQRNAKEKLETLTAARQEMSNQFEALANKILDEKAKKFTEQNQANLGNLIAPIREKFGEFQQKVESLEKDGIAGRSELKTEIAQLRTLNERLSQEANNLAGALKGSSKTQGDWGEYVLESILEASGLRKNHEYRVQESFAQSDDADRGRARLDVILDLPGGRHLVLDSKVSLNDYNAYCSSEEGALRDSSLTQHLNSVRKHIRELSGRNYQKLYGINSPDFVVMFVPIEPAFTLAIARDGRLWQEAWEKDILLVSPTTLLFVLRIVKNLWRQEQQAKNVQDIVRRGGELYDKLSAFAEDLTDVGDKLGKAQKAYDSAYRKLAEGKGNVIRQAEMLKELGVKPTKSLPPKLVEMAEDAVPVQEELLELAAAEENEAAKS